MPVGSLTAVFLALEKGLGIWDHHNKTKYKKRFKKLIEVIAEEEAKPIYDVTLHEDDLRNQNIIDRAQLELDLLLRHFLREKDDDYDHKK